MFAEIGVFAGVVAFVLIITILIGGRMTRSELEKDTDIKIWKNGQASTGTIRKLKVCKYHIMWKLHGILDPV